MARPPGFALGAGVFRPSNHSLHGHRLSTLFGTFSGGTLTVTAVKDFSAASTATGTFSASYMTNSKSRVTSVSGVASAGGKSLTLGGDSNVSNYRYSSPASFSELSGNWLIPLGAGASATVSVNSTGGFSLNLSGCAASGTMVARPSGKNVFNVTMTFGAAPCAFPGAVLSGVAFVAPNSFLSTSGDLRILVQNSAQTAGLLLAGTR